MTTISAKVIADSVSREGKRLTTLQLRYPLIIHAESKTHRLLSESGEAIDELITPGVMSDPALSRNARSSRAVPIERMIQEVIEDPFIPLHWGAAQPGMQAYAECDEMVSLPHEDHAHGAFNTTREKGWLWARDHAVDAARAFSTAGYAKQIANRLLNPFLHIDTLVSATEWDNFFELRLHHAAEPHMRILAEAMRDAMAVSVPIQMEPGDWHLPYISDEEAYSAGLGIPTLRKLSAARCARISYAPFDGDGSVEAELRRYDLLVGSRPLHATPVEHQATPDRWIDPSMHDKFDVYARWDSQGDHRNFVGWRQNRAFVEREMAGVA
jgi:hypothetical protein